MRLSARRSFAFIIFFLLLSLVFLFRRGFSLSSAAEQVQVFYGEDREETIFGTPANIDVDGSLIKETREGSSCIERVASLSEASPSAEDQADSHLTGAYCAVDRLRFNRFYLSFDTSALPDEATVSAATLYLTKAQIAASEFTARFEVLGSRWGDSSRLQAVDWDSGSTVLGTFDPPADDPAGSTYAIPLDPAAINRNGRTQFEVRLYDEPGATGFYGRFQEQVLQKNRSRIFYSGDAADQQNQPRLEVVLGPSVGPSSGLQLTEGWNKMPWPAPLSETALTTAVANIDGQCGSGTALAASRRTGGLWETYRVDYSSFPFSPTPEETFYLYATKDCLWNYLE